MQSGLIHHAAEAKQELGVPLEVQLTSVVRLETCAVSLAHSIHHTKRYLAASLLLCLLAK